MGEFRRRIKPGYQSKHHRRTAIFEAKLPSRQVDALDNAVTASKNWSGDELLTEGKLTTVRLEYGPVKGAYESDLVNFFTRHGLALVEHTFITAKHADSGCTHPECDG